MPARQESCCFTGHRPAKLPWGMDETDARCLRLKARIADALEAAYQSGYRHFICGMALGCDLYFCEAALACLRGAQAPRVLDLCAGSGAIGLSLAKLCASARVTLADVSAGACAVMEENRRRLDVKAEIVCGDLFAPVRGRKFDLIACNPPYIRTGELDTLQADVQKEPRLALDGGADGLDFYRRIAGEYRNYLATGGTLMLEIGWDEADSVRALFGGGSVLRDLGGHDRVIAIRE